MTSDTPLQTGSCNPQLSVESAIAKLLDATNINCEEVPGLSKGSASKMLSHYWRGDHIQPTHRVRSDKRFTRHS
ncbi:hypothetical protein AJ80_00320 [Polytolypa hystricis UAMH7299]|uniref:Uncharacterized protein n=1 Tax=Polytolypa hystricis (strain UAMH7299) TaxID=1447883 RepID=A0A2B7YVF2_POLH7|nr:hypothetical protein AJ80_00320 [Polytolypa hystricis UAMH7299]